MTYSDTGRRDTLYYRMLSGSKEAPGSWGHEYVRHLSSELGEEYNARITEEDEPKAEAAGNANGIKVDGKDGEVKREQRDYSVEELRSLAMELVDFNLKHNAEADAVDLLLELECIKEIVERVDDKTWPRVCQYMVR